MTILERFVYLAKEVRSEYRKGLPYQIIATSILFLLIYSVRNMGALSISLYFWTGYLLYLVVMKILYRKANGYMNEFSCPKCQTRIGQRFSFRNKLILEHMIRSPEEYRFCRKCKCDFEKTLWEDCSEV